MKGAGGMARASFLLLSCGLVDAVVVSVGDLGSGEQSMNSTTESSESFSANWETSTKKRADNRGRDVVSSNLERSGIAEAEMWRREEAHPPNRGAWKDEMTEALQAAKKRRLNETQSTPPPSPPRSPPNCHSRT